MGDEGSGGINISPLPGEEVAQHSVLGIDFEQRDLRKLSSISGRLQQEFCHCQD